MASEAAFYNAVHIASGGEYRKTAKAKEGHATWQKTWESIRAGAPDPEKESEKLAKADIHLILKKDRAYPPLLKEIAHAPHAIYVKGAIPQADAIAIVGTRKATPDGIKLARQFGEDLAKKGIAIISGLAFGIDAAAQTGCLDARGKTVAVLAGGLDRIYPRTNQYIGERILAGGGAIISEYPIGSEPFQRRFLERNRIVSGLARGTLVIEAPERSGSLATARFALEGNRDVFVIPGPVAHPNFKGSHELIRAGAELVTKPEDILASLGIESIANSSTIPTFESQEETLIYGALAEAGGSADVDRIAELTHLRISDVNRVLTKLVIKRAIAETGAGYSIIN